MGIQLLGPLALRGLDGTPIEVPGAQRRAVLALLVLELGRPVALNRFFELLWDEDPPVHAKAALQGHVAVLRKLLPGSGFTLSTRSPGYQLDGDPEQVDAHWMDLLVHQAASIADDRVAATSLRAAVDLRNGEPIADLPDTELRHALARRLDDAHMTAVIAWADRLLRLGEGGEAIPVLEQRVLNDALAEPLIARLMRCLHQAGRSSDAVTIYHNARTRLRDELGIVPGPGLQQALATVLAESDASAQAARPAAEPADEQTHTLVRPLQRVPDQMPRRPGSFTGRVEEIAWLDRHCGAHRQGGTLALVVGPAGVGKTATVARWAHSAAKHFRDGTLFADLRGFSTTGQPDITAVLSGFLSALGVAEAAIPTVYVDQLALYRERTANKELLVVLDNVRSATDLFDLLPAGEDCCTIVTSRNSLEDLVVTEGAVMLRMDSLSEGDAMALLRRQLGEERVGVDLASARRVLALCDRLPLALRVAAARLLGSPGWSMADLAECLADERTRLQALDTGGEISVLSALNLTCHHLPPEASRLLALLSAHPGSEVDTYAASAILGTGLAEARHALGSLAAFHLVSETSPARYSRHDLIRLYGTTLAQALGPESEREARQRLLRYYRASLRAAAWTVDPDALWLAPADDDGLTLPSLPTIEAAVPWFRIEEPGLRTLILQATEHGEFELAWQIARLSDTLYTCTERVTDRISTMRAGLEAARRSADPLALPQMQAATASALNAAGRPAEALELARRAVARSSPEDGGVHVAGLITLATITAGLGEIDAAQRLSGQALDIMHSAGVRVHAAPALANAAALKGVTGAPRIALRYARAARRLLADRPRAPYHVSAMVNEAHALDALGRREEAEVLWIEALARCNYAGTQVRALAERQYAEFLLTVGRRAEAAGHLRRAIELYTVRGNLLVAQHLSTQLAQWEQPA